MRRIYKRGKRENVIIIVVDTGMIDRPMDPVNPSIKTLL